MGLGDFWLQFDNGKKEQLSDIRGDIRIETVDPKYRSLFSKFDFNKNGALEAGETSLFVSLIAYFAGDDNTLDVSEAKSIFGKLGIELDKNIDFLDFAKSVSDANKKILSTSEEKLPDGSRKTVTEYVGGLRLTVVYFPDGDLKYTVTEVLSNADVITSKALPLGNEGTVKTLDSASNQQVLSRNVKFTDRAEFELEFDTGIHYQENAEYLYNMMNKFDSDKTFWDIAGVDAKEAWKNKNPINAFTAEGMKNFEAYYEKAFENYQKSKEFTEKVEQTPAAIQGILATKCGVKENDFEVLEDFHQTAFKFVNAKSLVQRTEFLEKGIKEVKQLYQNYITAQKGLPGTEKLDTNYDKKFMEVLTEYFNGDEEMAVAFFESIKEGLETGTKEENEKSNIIFTILDKIQKSNDSALKDILQGEKFENIEDRYKSMYKIIYGEDYMTSDVEDMIQSGQQVGGMVKLGAMTTAQIVMSTMTMGIGNAALITVMNNPITQLLTTAGTNYALSVAGALTSKTGMTAEKNKMYIQESVGMMPFIGLGMLSAPAAKLVGNTLAKYTGKLFDYGTKAVTGAITTTTVTGENIFRSFCTKAADLAGNFGTELGVFTGYEMLTEDEDFKKAFGNQGEMLGQLKVMNKFLQVLLGRFMRAQAAKGQQKMIENQFNKMLKEAGLDKAKIQKHETPQGVKYTGEIDGIKFAGESEAEVLGKLLSVAAFKLEVEGKLEGVKEGVNERVNEVNEKVKKEGYPDIPGLDKLVKGEGDGVWWMSDLQVKAKDKVYQKEAGLYLDKLLEQVQPAESTKGQPIKFEVDYMLPDGTFISRKRCMSEKVVLDEYGWPISGAEIPMKDEIVFWIKDTNGKEHIIPALSKENYEKAQKIFDYIYTLEEVPFMKINEVQQARLKELENRKTASNNGAKQAEIKTPKENLEDKKTAAENKANEPKNEKPIDIAAFGKKKLAEQKQFEENSVEDYKTKSNQPLLQYMKENNFPKDIMKEILLNTNKKNVELAEKLCKNSEVPNEQVGKILEAINKKYRKMLNENVEVDRINKFNDELKSFTDELVNNKDFPIDLISNVLENVNELNMEFAKKLCLEGKVDEYWQGDIPRCLKFVNEENLPLALKMYEDNVIIVSISDNLLHINKNNSQIANKLYELGEFDVMNKILKATEDESISPDKITQDVIVQVKEINNVLSANCHLYNQDFVNLLIHAPEKYKKIVNSGILGMIDNYQLDSEVLKRINKNADFSDDIYKDLELVKNGKSIVSEFPENTGLHKAFKQTKVGDVVEVGNKMYINDGTKLIEWKMTKAKYLELFPPVERFATVQHGTGDCYLISSISHIMSNPNTRVDFYKSFEYDGKDVKVTIKGYEDYQGSYKFIGGKFDDKFNDRHAIGCQGVQMYERTYAKVALRTEGTKYAGTMTIDDLMDRIDGGREDRAISEILGYDHSSKFYNNIILSVMDFEIVDMEKIPYTDPITKEVTMKDVNAGNINQLLDNYDINNQKTPIVLEKLDINSLEALLIRAANSHDYMLDFGSHSDLLKYNIQSQHAHSVVGYDAKTKTVKINQPTNYSLTTDVPLEKFYSALKDITYTRVAGKTQYQKAAKPTKTDAQSKEEYRKQISEKINETLPDMDIETYSPKVEIEMPINNERYKSGKKEIDVDLPEGVTEDIPMPEKIKAELGVTSIHLAKEYEESIGKCKNQVDHIFGKMEGNVNTKFSMVANVSTRAKGAGSIEPKLEKGLRKKGHLDYESARECIGDAVGARIITKNLYKLTDAEINRLIDQVKIDNKNLTPKQKELLKKYIYEEDTFKSKKEKMEAYYLYENFTRPLVESRNNEVFEELALSMLKNKMVRENLTIEQMKADFDGYTHLLDRLENDPNIKPLEVLEINNYTGMYGIPEFTYKQMLLLRHIVGDEGVLTRADITEDNLYPSTNYISIEEALKNGNEKLPKAIKSSGYRTAQMNVVFEDGTLGEIQFRGEETNKIGEYEHIAYDLRQGKNTLGKMFDEYKEAISELNDTEYEEYNTYLESCYNYYSRMELGLPAKKPKLPEKFNPILSEENMKKLHDENEERLKELKKGFKPGLINKGGN